MSDSESVDSDEGVRYKTENVRNKLGETNHKDKPHAESQNRTTNRNRRKSSTSSPSSDSDRRGKSISFLKEENEFIGPALPPEFLNRDHGLTEASPIGPVLPPHLTKSFSGSTSIGPALPPHVSNKFSEELSTSTRLTPQSPSSLEKSRDIIAKPTSAFASIGPQLPPHMLNKNRPLSSEQHNELIAKSNPESSSVVMEGPSPNSKPESPETKEKREDDVKTIGPSLPPHLRKQLQEHAEQHFPEENLGSDDDGEMYGPLPAGLSKYSAAEMALEERALQIQIDQLGPQGNNQPVRETWMIDLPEGKASTFGLGPRQFKNRAGPDMSDRSSWTDIPGEKGTRKNKEKKIDLKAETEFRELQKRDKEQELLTKKYKRKSKSLVDIHEDKLRKKEKDSNTGERKPFNRETDLQVNKFDEAQKKAVMKKAQLLDDRFSSGKTKFL